MRTRTPTPRPRPHLAALAAAVGAATLAGGCGSGGPVEPATVGDAWAAPVGDGTAAAAYLTVTAAGDDELEGARVARDVARRAQVVNPADTSEDGPGHLGHLDPGGSLNGGHAHTLELPAGAPVALEPGGAHLALDALAAPLAPGDTFTLTLLFAEGPDVDVEVEVATEAPEPPG